MSDFPPVGTLVVVNEHNQRDGRPTLIRRAVLRITHVWPDEVTVCEAEELHVFLHVEGYPELGRHIPARGLTGVLADSWYRLF